MTNVNVLRDKPIFQVNSFEEIDEIIKSKDFKKQFGDFTSNPPEPLITLADKFYDILENPNLDIRQDLLNSFGKQSASFNSENIMWEIFFDFSLFVVVKGCNLGLVVQYIGPKGALDTLENYIRKLDSPPPKEEIDQFIAKVNEVIEKCRNSK